MPAGWFFNYSNIFNEELTNTKLSSPTNILSSTQNAPNITQKKGKNANQNINQNTNRKQWSAVEFLKLLKKFEDLTAKPLE